MSSQLHIYFNTINLTGTDLANSRQCAGRQNDEVLQLFRLYPSQDFTPAEVYNQFQSMGRNYPITSIRRAITTLTNLGYLYCTNNMRMGLHGVKNYCWKLK